FAMLDIAQLTALGLFFYNYTRRHIPMVRRAFVVVAFGLAIYVFSCLWRSDASLALSSFIQNVVPVFAAIVYAYGAYTTFISSMYLYSIRHGGHRPRVLWTMSACFFVAFLFVTVRAFTSISETV